jgi:hypothetical protein
MSLTSILSVGRVRGVRKRDAGAPRRLAHRTCVTPRSHAVAHLERQPRSVSAPGMPAKSSYSHAAYCSLLLPRYRRPSQFLPRSGRAEPPACNRLDKLRRAFAADRTNFSSCRPFWSYDLAMTCGSHLAPSHGEILILAPQRNSDLAPSHVPVKDRRMLAGAYLALECQSAAIFHAE